MALTSKWPGTTRKGVGGYTDLRVRSRGGAPAVHGQPHTRTQPPTYTARKVGLFSVQAEKLRHSWNTLVNC